jgi:hypothetical protein
MSKAQTEIVSIILIVAIALGLTASVYTWGLPLIQKRQDTSKMNSVSGFFDQNNINSLPTEIELVANNGGEKTLTFDVDGVWNLSETENSISFFTHSLISNICIAGSGSCPDWVSLTPGATCPPTYGIIGVDKSSVVCANVVPLGNGFGITYKVYFRGLADISVTKGSSIILFSESGVTSSTGKSIRISRDSMYTDTISGIPISLTKIKILLG